MARPRSSLTVREFVALLAQVGGAKIVSLATATRKAAGDGMVVKSRATGQPTVEVYPLGVERQAVGRFILNFDYDGNVNAQRIREDKPADFVSQALWISKAHPEGAARSDPEFPRYMVYHVDTLVEYLRTRPHQNKWGKIVKEHDRWVNVATGQPITGPALDDLYANYLASKSPSKKQDLEKNIPVRTFELPNIMAACHARRWYTMTQAHTPAGV